MNSFELIRNALQRSEFKTRVERISSFASYTKQERLIQYAIADLLDKDGSDIWLEYKKSDIKVYDALVELKFFYEFDMHQLEKEISELGDISNYEIKRKGPKKSQSKINMAIYKDFFKLPDIFLLIIQSRDLKDIKKGSNLSKKIKYFGKEKSKFNQFGYSYCDENLLYVATRFIENLKKYFQMPLNNKRNSFQIDIHTKTLFPSCYHFYGYLLK